MNNPVRFIDPDGMEADDVVDAESEIGEGRKMEGDGGNDPPSGGGSVLPPGSPMQGAEKFVPSAETTNLINQAKEFVSNILGGDIEISGSILARGLEVTAGPLSAGVEGTLGEVSASSTESNLVEVEGKAISVSGKVGLGGTQVTGNVDVAKGKVEVSRNGKVSASGKSASASGNVKRGNVTLKNSGSVGVGAKVGPVKANVSVNLVEAAKAAQTIVLATASYLTDCLSHIMN